MWNKIGKSAVHIGVAAALLGMGLSGCDSVRPKSNSDSSGTPPATTELGAPYGAKLGPDSALVVSEGKVIAGKELATAASQAQDPGLVEFQSALHAKLVGYCGSCHKVGSNKYTFASDGAFVAYAAFKEFANVDPEQSKIVINIRAGHNGVKPEWADEVAPLVKAVAEKVQP